MSRCVTVRHGASRCVTVRRGAPARALQAQPGSPSSVVALGGGGFFPVGLGELPARAGVGTGTFQANTNACVRVS